MDRLADFRAVFAEVVTARGGSRDPRIKAAFAKVPRHEFLDPGPWRFGDDGPLTESDDPALLYQDIGVEIARGVPLPTGLPSLHARCLDACRPATGEHVVHVGAGRGYFTAIIAELVGATGSVRAFEIETGLAEMARRSLAPWAHVHVEARSGTGEHPAAHVLYVSAGVQQIPLTWLRTLREGGRLLLPLVPGDAYGGALLVSRRGRDFDARFVVAPCRFVPCIGATDAHAVTALRAAFAEDEGRSVRSLRLAEHEAPDGSCWVAGQGWWLSRAEPSGA
jgi:protein-L-isoaspartate(D-aspartate) O-methyltransferase